MSLTVTVVLDSCSDCRHKALGYKSVENMAGPHPVCGHPDRKEPKKINKPYNIPRGCPLRTGSTY